MKIKFKYLLVAITTLLTFSCNLGSSSKPETKDEAKTRIIKNIKLSINSTHIQKDKIHAHYNSIDNIMNKVDRGETFKEEEKLDEPSIDRAIQMGTEFNKNLIKINAPLKEFQEFMTKYKGQKSFTKAELDEFKSLKQEFFQSKMPEIGETLDKMKVLEKVENKIEELRKINTYAWWDGAWKWIKKAASDVVSIAKKVHDFLGGDKFDEALKKAYDFFTNSKNITDVLNAILEAEEEALE